MVPLALCELHKNGYSEMCVQKSILPTQNSMNSRFHGLIFSLLHIPKRKKKRGAPPSSIKEEVFVEVGCMSPRTPSPSGARTSSPHRVTSATGTRVTRCLQTILHQMASMLVECSSSDSIGCMCLWTPGDLRRIVPCVMRFA